MELQVFPMILGF
uniref:Uncharacterized protein n=1 Tax=Arundo donax TaxID=35708 RepID=A0A0A9CFM0_ARUDO